MEGGTLLRDLAVVMVLGGAVTALFHRLRQPVVLGYIIAGVLIGPHTPPFAFIRDQHSIETLGELGVILLLFSIGLEFSLRKLRRVGGVAVIGASVEIPLMIWIGYSVGRAVGWGAMDSLFLGAILSISSTTIIAKVLMELELTRADFARIIMGILIAEDIAAIVMLVLLSGVASAGDVDLTEVVFALGKVGLFVVSVTLVGLLTLPRLLHRLARVPSREVLTITVLGLCFGTAILGAELGFSVALGAFLAGAVMAETPEVHRVEERIEPIRDMFSAMFFVAAGLSIDPTVLRNHWALVLFLSVVTILGKVAACSFATMVAGYAPRTAFRVGMGLAQIGEFSFIIANLGRSTGVISDFLYPIVVAVSAVTTLTTPYLVRYAEQVADTLESGMPRLLRDFFAFYDRRLERWQGRRRAFGFPEEAKWPALRVAAAGSLLLTLLLTARFLAAGAGSWLHPSDVPTSWLNAAIWSACGVASVPLLIALWRSGGEVSTILSGRLTGRTDGSRVVTEAFRFALTVIAALVFLAIASPFFPTGIPLLATALLVGASAFLFWRSLVGVQEEAERSLGALFVAGDAAEAAPQARTELTTLIRQKYAFDLTLEDFIVPFTDSAASRTIRELALRTRTGATIAAIYRGEKAIVNPDPDVALEPGDVLLLLGSREQVETAMRHLEGLAAGRVDRSDADG